MTTPSVDPDALARVLREPLTLVVRGVPQPKGSTRSFIVNGHAVTTSDNRNLKDWAQAIAWEARAAMAARRDPRLIEGPLSVTVTFIQPRPKTKPRSRFPLPTTKPDLDKLARGALDALTGVVFRDDAQVVRLSAAKRYDDDMAPGAVVEIVEVTA